MFLTLQRRCRRARPALPVILGSTLLLADCGGGYSGGNMGPPLMPTVTFTIDQMTITAGQTAQLSWTTMNAASCVASGGWSGNVDVNGKEAVMPTTAGTATYTLTCTAPTGGAYGGGGGGQTAQTVTLTVNAASAYSATNLVSDTGTGALNTDSNLVNAWGIVFGTGAPVWVANNHSDTSTLYDGTGKPQPTSGPLIVATPDLDPTGIVFSPADVFLITVAGSTTPARFIFAGESGHIAAWARAAGTTAVTVYPAAGGDTGGAIYKGLAIAQRGTTYALYATDFHNNKVDVFDGGFSKMSLAAGAFVDPNLPAGYAPFGIQAINNGTGGTAQIYVTYAKQDANAADNVSGAGLGLVDIYDVNGVFIKRLIDVGGAANAPWGMALAPADFGTLSNALLVGNFGDGKIYGYDPASGRFIGAVTDSHGTALSTDGLWGIAFGNDAANQPHNTLFFAAGPSDEGHGLYGRIDLGATPPVLN
jgi:uncharacterized protein (TIGR03118 family)